ncbi:putative Ser Thr protein phosphatase superfamily [Rosellinia necatrix]|uniref:Putative Ser Thr protein phosphatase superfamily n=1 Tax=Rosellinia necatrix TaxID=77044 RepID=A0A1W2TTH3_ROSNE|nr:putative Ser Thr protein phosphatase superfamily [Rosellinia necatrix]
MSAFAPRFQILSDLHLETPISQPLYQKFRLCVGGSHVLMLGDIGLVLDDALFSFLRDLLTKARGSRFFYILGNHEPYRTTLSDAIARLRAFEEEARCQYGGRFVFLSRDRFDVNADTTILGCTLWSDVLPQQATEVNTLLTDFHESNGIRDWTLESHVEEHRKDRDWLNSQVRRLEETEPQRQIIIATHHSPTLDPRAVEPAHQSSSVSSAFATDMSKDLCWASTAVRLWVFGHTHYNCGFRDEATGKLVVANQRGYGRAEIQELLIEPDANGFNIVTPTKDNKTYTNHRITQQVSNPANPTTVTRLHRSILHRAADRIPRIRRLWTRMTERPNETVREVW